MAGRPDIFAQKISDAARPATEIEAAPASGNTDAVQQNARIRGDRIGLHTEAFDLPLAGFDRILRCGCTGHAHDPKVA